MKHFKIRLLAVRIELNWWFIRRLRKKGARLLKEGYSHSSEKMLKLNGRYSKYCASAMTAQREYERRTGIKADARIMGA